MMQRFLNQPLRPQPHIAVCGSDKVGNFVVTTPLLRGLKEKYPGSTTDFYGGATTRALEEGCPYIDARFSLYGNAESLLRELGAFVTQRRSVAGEYDLLINCDGFGAVNSVLAAMLAPRYVVGASLLPNLSDVLKGPENDLRERLLNDREWDRASLVAEYGGALTSNYIGEIFCRLAYVETDYYRPHVATKPPACAIPEVLLHMAATRSAKQWPAAHWKSVLSWCQSQRVTVGVVGSGGQASAADESAEADYDRLIQEFALPDLRGRTTLPELAGAFQQARAAIVVDSGPMHIATAVGCPTVCVVGNDQEGDGASPIRLWSPRADHLHIVHAAVKCRLCRENRFQNRHCLLTDHLCMESVRPAAVIAELERILNRP